MHRSTRMTRVAIIVAESTQAEVIATLLLEGEDDLAWRMARCQSARLWRGSGWLWRCHSAGCWSCRRTMMRVWWRGISEWAGQDALLISLPLGDDPIAAMRRIRRGLRDVRDRAARRHLKWRSVSIGGMVRDGLALVLVSHPEIAVTEVLAVLRRRWPEAAIIADDDLTWSMTVDTAVALALRRRGVEPLRAIIMPQADRSEPTTRTSGHLEPMPMLF
jgi:hypothetical protein